MLMSPLVTNVVASFAPAPQTCAVGTRLQKFAAFGTRAGVSTVTVLLSILHSALAGGLGRMLLVFAEREERCGYSESCKQRWRSR